jgi:chromosome segregation ATPase
MSYFGLERFRTEHDELERAKRELRTFEENITEMNRQHRNAEYDREQEDYRARVKLERERENSRELRFNLYEEKKRLKDELEDLKLRRKFGVEGG